jgi:acyl-CoA synthetase (AMP-forming)/AMP-acid ligase II
MSTVCPPLPASVPERTVRDLLDTRAVAVPEHTALIAPSLLAGEEVRISYGDLRARAGRIAGALASAGVGKGDRVGILLANDAAAEAHAVYHATHRLGAINVPLNTRYVARELGYVLSFVAPAAVVFSGEYAPLLAGLREALGDAALLEIAPEPRLGRSFERAVEDDGADPADAEITEHDDADWIFTSGTTGNPKAVALTHANSVACGYEAIPLWDIDATSVYQSSAPFFTSTGCHTNLLSCLVAGCTYAIEPEFDVVDTLERMRRYGTTATFLVNSVLALIFKRRGEEALTEGGFPALRRICYGAQAGSPEFCERVWQVSQRLGVEVVNVYGLTETGNAGMMLSPEDHPEALSRMGNYGISIGRTTFHPWVEHTILDADGKPAAVGEVGELCMRGPSSMSRYVQEPEATAKVLRGGWVHTGDACLADDAGFVYFVDRDKQLIRRSGLNISSVEVEGVLLEHPGIAEAAVVPTPNPVLGEDVRAVVVAAVDPPPEPAEVIAFCRQRLADYKVPAVVDFVPALPRNGMGRVLKTALTGQGSSLAIQDD